MAKQTSLNNISKKLELRQTNKEAVQAFLTQYYNLENNPEKLSECILSVATGVGKTYIIAAILNYLAEAEKITNFLIVAPGKIIREKTINNFSLNKPNSLADKLTIKPPHIVDIKNFHTVKTTDKNSVKLFIFTVQSLTQAKGKMARKTSNYDEVLGKSLREHLSKLDDLVIFADEHHLYYGEKFSEAIRELKPKTLIGLTGTPHKETPSQEIIFHYCLGYALHDKLVKQPVLVGRSDSWDNEESKLKDAITLLGRKQKLLDHYTQQQQLFSRKALMLIITKNIEHAKEAEQILDDCGFPKEQVLRVDSSSINEEMAQQLQTIDNPLNPIRIIITVGMLKEGWDVKGVYVIVPLRAFASEILTEQVMGRGLRLPFGNYTPINFLNQLEIIAHDKFQDLVKDRKVLSRNFFGEPPNENNTPFDNNSPSDEMTSNSPSSFNSGNYSMPDLPVSDFHDREKASEVEKWDRLSNFPKNQNFTIPILTQKPKLTNFSLEFILLDKNKQKIFTELGKSFSSWEKARNYLERYEIRSDIGGKQVQISKITDELIKASEPELSSRQIEELRTELIKALLEDCVTRDKHEIELATELIDNYFLPQPPNWQVIMDCRGIIITQLKRKVQEIAHQYNLQENKGDLVHQIDNFTFGEHTRKEIIATDWQENSLQKSYQFSKSLYHYDNFDSFLEKDLAILLNNSLGIKRWVRLQKDKNFFIYYWGWKRYYPDFLVIENDDYWLIETKNDNNTEEKVKAKKEVARKWVNKLNRELIKQKSNIKWHFLYITPKDIKQSHNNWATTEVIGR